MAEAWPTTWYAASVSQGYQNRDRAIVDYQLWQLDEGRSCTDWLRGPAPPTLEPGSYFACVGAAQTFGCFAERPFPSLLAEQIGLPSLNLGIAGAGPGLFLNPALLKLLQNARFVIVQAMSGRSADCSRFQSGGRERLSLPDGRVLGADTAWSELLQQDLEGHHNQILRGVRNRMLATFGRRHVRKLVAETQHDWAEQNRALLDAIDKPTVFLWFSRRMPDHQPRFHSLRAMFGEFPQLVSRSMVAAAQSRADRYVECTTSRGSPQPLAQPVRPSDAGTGEPPDAIWTHNDYYPSPEMHEDAAEMLLPIVQKMGR